MAANIEIGANGQARAFAAYTPAWWDAAKKNVVSQALTAAQAIIELGINYPLEKHQMINPLTMLPEPEMFGVFRMDNQTCLSKKAVGKGYTVVQPTYAFEFVDTILEAHGGAHYVTGGFLGKGEVMWVLAKVGDGIRVKGTHDVSETYLLFVNSFDGSMSVTVKLTVTRVVCQNTLTIALHDQGAMVKIRHSKNAMDALKEAQGMAKGTLMQVEDVEQKINELARRKVNKTSFIGVMKRLFGDWEKVDEGTNTTKTTNKIAEIAGLFESNDGNEIPEIRGSGYNLLNSITEYVDHHSNVRRTAAKVDMSPELIRSQNALFGEGAKLKETALEIILQETEGADRLLIPETVYSVMKATEAAMAPAPSAPRSILDDIVDETTNGKTH